MILNFQIIKYSGKILIPTEPPLSNEGISNLILHTHLQRINPSSTLLISSGFVKFKPSSVTSVFPIGVDHVKFHVRFSGMLNTR